MQVNRRPRTQLERLEDLQATLRATFKNEAAPARHLALSNAGPAAPQVRTGQINQVTDRRWFRTKELDPGTDDKRARTMDHDMKSALQQSPMLLNQSAVQAARDIGH